MFQTIITKRILMLVRIYIIEGRIRRPPRKSKNVTTMCFLLFLFTYFCILILRPGPFLNKTWPDPALIKSYPTRILRPGPIFSMSRRRQIWSKNGFSFLFVALPGGFFLKINCLSFLFVTLPGANFVKNRCLIF